ncbi:MAG: bifunctional endoribonuclease/protein kinase ire1 [Piccolia ochrophora]|nr:MAG: bifunctional endoribonuclease/protein kinase ire1 [Piccolia ochrophora]
MPRRPLGPGAVVSSAIVIALFILPILIVAQQQQQLRQNAPTEGRDNRAPPDAPARSPEDQAGESPQHLKNFVASNDASAIATLAPAKIHHAVRAPSAGLTERPTGLSPLLHARSLQDWEVEEFILLATVDGTIHARDRRTGAARWALEVDRPMVETTYYRQNKSDGRDYRPENDLLWIVEPSRDGSLYVYNPSSNPGLQKLGLTVKELEQVSPWQGDDPPVVYTAERKTTLYTVDASSGRILKRFSSGGSLVQDDSSCRRVSGLELVDDDACGSGGTLTLGRTEYTVGIQSRLTGESICTLKYAEWGPNNRDSDLQGQYDATLDKKYVYSRHDGSIFGFDHARMDDRRKSYTQKFSSPVARVFDVARPTDTNARDAPLVILAQPTAPLDNEDLSAGFMDRNSRIFVNCTERGSWYALSEAKYPLVTGAAAPAQCYSHEWLQTASTWDEINPKQRKEALVGVHSIANHRVGAAKIPTISGPQDEGANDTPLDASLSSQNPASAPAIANSRLLGYAAQNAVDIGITLPFILFVVFLYINRRKFARLVTKTLDMEKIPGVKEALMSPPSTPAIVTESYSHGFDDARVASDQSREDAGQTPTKAKRVDFAETAKDTIDSVGTNVVELEAPPSPPQPKKKKTHRGQRGGAGRKKSRKDSNANKDNLDRIVEEVKAIRNEPQLEPDIVKVNGSTNDVTDVSGPFQINNLVVTDNVLGYGSHGTIVYRGSFEGREVAVKRMLLEFYDVASHEVGLLQESDDHPNVIRYFCRQQSSGFLYIALELCPASLQDVVEKPWGFKALAQASLRDLPNVLYQIASGVRYLHSLKIVHRDIKPQNILVAYPKVSKTDPDIVLPPRVLISDFGLCKKLEGDQSSFRATTAHAAGTSGWRAPELLVDDDASPAPPMVSDSAHSGETSEPAIIDTLSNRRATRAIDIFSLGCVFFYILSRGAHPFGDRYMREANIVKGQYKLDALQSLADYGHEATALIEAMIDHNPRARPDAATVMTHPFFWSAEKRLNFLVDVSDHFEGVPRDPPCADLQTLESVAPEVLGVDFLKRLDKAFVDTLGKQRKYTGSRMLDLLRALRNKVGLYRGRTLRRGVTVAADRYHQKNHYQDMPDNVKAHVGPLPHGYLQYWAARFPLLLLQCFYVVIKCRLEDLPRFKAYFAIPI